jgi:hypothetical protein
MDSSLTREPGHREVCEGAREPPDLRTPGTANPDTGFLWRTIYTLPDAVAVEHAGECCRQYRPLREVAVLKDPHIVFPGKAKLLGRCLATNIVPFGKGLCRAGLPKACYIVPPGKVYRLLRETWERFLYRLARELIPSCRGSLVVPPGKVYRPAWEGISSRLGRYIVLCGKVYRPLQEIGSPFLLQKRDFLTIIEASVLYLSVVIV